MFEMKAPAAYVPLDTGVVSSQVHLLFRDSWHAWDCMCSDGDHAMQTSTLIFESFPDA